MSEIVNCVFFYFLNIPRLSSTPNSKFGRLWNGRPTSLLPHHTSSNLTKQDEQTACLYGFEQTAFLYDLSMRLLLFAINLRSNSQKSVPHILHTFGTHPCGKFIFFVVCGKLVISLVSYLVWWVSFITE